MTAKKQKKPIETYFETHDKKYIAEDAVFIDMGMDEVIMGREAIDKMLYHIYHIAFNARAEITNTIVTDNKAVVEATFTGTHTGEFAGIPATGRKVRVPLCVSYELENSLIKVARIYLLNNILLKQLTE